MPRAGKELTETVLESVMGRAWPDVVGSAELLDVPQPLKLWPASVKSFSAIRRPDKHTMTYVSMMAHMVGPNGTVCQNTIKLPKRLS